MINGIRTRPVKKIFQGIEKNQSTQEIERIEKTFLPLVVNQKNRENYAEGNENRHRAAQGGYKDKEFIGQPCMDALQRIKKGNVKAGQRVLENKVLDNGNKKIGK